MLTYLAIWGHDTPSEDKLKKFDANNDNVYSLEELAAAFGFSMGMKNSHFLKHQS